MDVIKQIAVEPATAFAGTNLVNADAVWASGTTYALGNKVTYQYRVYQSLAGTNLNNIPPTGTATYQDDPLPTAWWVFIGPANTAAMFDFKGNTVSTAVTSFYSRWALSYPLESIALLDVHAVTVRLVVRDNSTSGTVMYDQIKGLSDVTIGDWYDYFFLPATAVGTQIVFDGIPAPFAGHLNYYEITVVGASGMTVTVGSIVGGPKYYLGLTQYGFNTGIISYSKKTVDDYGNVKITKRAFAKRMEGDVEIPNSDVNRIQTLMYSLRDLPCVWIGQQNDPRFQELLFVYGYYKDFSTKIAYPLHSVMSLQVEGLIQLSLHQPV